MMFTKQHIATLLLAATTTVNAQAVTFRDAVANQPDLSYFNALLQLDTRFADLITTTGGENDNTQTVLVPNNGAIQAFMVTNQVTSPEQITYDQVAPFLSYHVLKSNVSIDQFNRRGGLIAPTRLRDERFSLFKEGETQVVYAKPAAEEGKGPEVESGLKEKINVVKSDIFYETGQIHIVDGFLTLPTNCSDTIANNGAERLVDVLDRVNLTDTLDSTRGATCFAPDDESILSAAATISNLTDQEVIDALLFHTLGDPFYTTELTDGQQLPTLLGPSITVNIVDDKFYFNGVRAKTVNDIARNGVAYVLEGIMPYNFSGVIPPETESPTSSAPPSSTPTPTGNGTGISVPEPTGNGGSGAANLNVGAGALVAIGLMALVALF